MSKPGQIPANPDRIYSGLGWDSWASFLGTDNYKYIWTKEAVIADAKKYKTRSEWQRANGSAYQAGHTHGWLEEACAHMPKRQRGWCKKSVAESARQYSHRTEWHDAEKGAYLWALRNGCLKEVIAHMPAPVRREKGEVIAIATRYKTRSEWERGDLASYIKARKAGWMEEACAHMAPARPMIRRTKEEVIADALKYSTRYAWAKGSGGAYKKAQKEGWLAVATRHMPRFAKRTKTA